MIAEVTIGGGLIGILLAILIVLIILRIFGLI